MILLLRTAKNSVQNNQYYCTPYEGEKSTTKKYHSPCLAQQCHFTPFSPLVMMLMQWFVSWLSHMLKKLMNLLYLVGETCF